MAKENHKRLLQSAKARRTLIKCWRKRFDGTNSTLAYVVAVGRDLAAFQVLGNDLRFDGFLIYRLRDVSRVHSPAATRAFVEKSLKLRGQRRPAAGRIDVASVRAALEWANRRFPLVAIHREEVNNNTCHIGRIEEFGARTFKLYAIAPDAQFQEDRDTFAYSDVTRIDAGGGYEEALALVAGLIKPRR